MLGAIRKWWNRLGTPEASWKNGYGRLRVDPDGMQKVAMDSEVAIFDVRWSMVREIVVWKDDLLTVDRICFGFRIGEQAEYLAITEDEQGWRDVGVVIAERFGVSETSWFGAVLQPPFATNWTTVWGEPPSHAGKCSVKYR